MKFNSSLLFALLMFCLSCQGDFASRESKLESCADSFANHYFNYHFDDALRFCTPESGRWLQYAATNVHEADVEVLKTQKEGAGIVVGNIEMADDDSTALVEIQVSNYLQMDTIGTRGHIVQQATFRLPAVYREKQWKIRMEGLPRNETNGPS